MLITAADTALHETANATMRTFAAPSLGSEELAVWEVRMAAGAQGPEHQMDREQVWVILDGAIAVELAGEILTATAGDALVLAAGVPRRISANDTVRALVSSVAGSMVTVGGAEPRELPWTS